MRSDIALGLLRDRYLALARIGADAAPGHWFEARMMARRALVVRGEDGVRTFYDPSLVSRRGAVPAPVRLLLFGPGAVHGLDGEQHARRKRLHLQVLDGGAAERLGAEVSLRLQQAVPTWAARKDVRLFDELVQVYGASVLAWAGIETSQSQVASVSSDLAAVVDGFGIGGTTYAGAAVARIRTQRWARRLIQEVRRGTRHPDPGTALDRLARAELPALVAATELLNLLRPTVAVAYFGAYAAHALDAHPLWRKRLVNGSSAELRAFELEVRRWYPFTPLLTGRMHREYIWDGRTFPRRSWIVLDVIGTNHDPSRWPDPDAFLPERFLEREPNAFEYVPHGGGDPAAGHRCPGEPMAESILQATLRALANLDFELEGPSRTVQLRRIP
jgi:fatty-acid peroxygenase